MKKYFLVGFVCAALVCFCALPSLKAAEAPADGLVLKMTKKHVVFNHSAHKSLDCKTCHHTWDGKSAIQKCSTKGCHDNVDRKAKGVHSYYEAMHARKGSHDSCLACHKKVAKKDHSLRKKLTSCMHSACHP